jgi:hypothetical protein
MKWLDRLLRREAPAPVEHQHRWSDLAGRQGDLYVRVCLDCPSVQRSPVPFEKLEKK